MNFTKIPTIKNRPKGTLQYNERLDSIDEIFKYLKDGQDFVQFGVAAGHSARYILSKMHKNNRLFLLDSFEGLPENWGDNPNQKKGAFKLNKNQIPKFIDTRVNKIKGLFKDTVKILIDRSKPLTFIHIDCDLYQSTIDALFGIGEHLMNPCYILFDEFYNYPEYEDHEYKAFFEFIDKFNLKYKALFKTTGSQVAFKVWR